MLKVLHWMGPVWGGRVFIFVAVVSTVLRALLNSLVGVLLLSAGLYCFQLYLGDIKPWTAQQLAVWLSEASTDVKSALATSLITAVGFFIAVRIASQGWKSEARGILQLKATSDFQAFFSEATRLIMESELYVGQLIEVAESVRTDGITPVTRRKIQRLLRGQPKFASDRDRLSQMLIERHSLVVVHSAVLDMAFGLRNGIDGAMKAFGRVTAHMWVAELSGDPEDEFYITAFLECTDLSKCATFVEACEENGPLVAGLAGGVHAGLLSQVFPPGLWSLVNTLKTRHEIPKFLKQLGVNETR